MTPRDATMSDTSSNSGNSSFDDNDAAVITSYAQAVLRRCSSNKTRNLSSSFNTSITSTNWCSDSDDSESDITSTSYHSDHARLHQLCSLRRNNARTPTTTTMTPAATEPAGNDDVSAYGTRRRRAFHRQDAFHVPIQTLSDDWLCKGGEHNIAGSASTFSISLTSIASGDDDWQDDDEDARIMETAGFSFDNEDDDDKNEDDDYEQAQAETYYHPTLAGHTDAVVTPPRNTRRRRCYDENDYHLPPSGRRTVHFSVSPPRVYEIDRVPVDCYADCFYSGHQMQTFKDEYERELEQLQQDRKIMSSSLSTTTLPASSSAMVIAAPEAY